MAERPLSQPDRVAFRDELARIYPDEVRLHGVLSDVGYPAACRPGWRSGISGPGLSMT